MQAHHITLPIYNLGCGGDVNSVEHTLTHVPGVTHVYVNPATEMAYVEYDPSLANVTHLFAALEREGFGQPARRPEHHHVSQPAPKSLLDTQRMALAGGILLGGMYILCVLAGLLFPQVVQMASLWKLVLIGFDWTNRVTMLIGLFEALLYGAVSAWALATLYNLLPARSRDTPATTCCASQQHAAGQESTVNA